MWRTSIIRKNGTNLVAFLNINNFLSRRRIDCGKRFATDWIDKFIIYKDLKTTKNLNE